MTRQRFQVQASHTRISTFHKIADRDHSDHGVILHDWKMAKIVLGHEGHTVVYGVLLTHEDNWAGHNLVDRGLLWQRLAGLGRIRDPQLYDR